MIRIAALFVAMALTGCLHGGASQPQPEITQSPVFQFVRACTNFYEIVDSIQTQVEVGYISEDTKDEINPYVLAGDAICQDQVRDSYTDATADITAILAEINVLRGDI
jgi:hypothetical protein